MQSGLARSKTVAPPAGSFAQLASVLGLLALLVGLTATHRMRGAAPPAARSPDVSSPDAEPVAGWVDPADARVVRAPAWADPRWLEQVRALCLEQEPLPLGAAELGGPEPVEALAERLAGLSFVERVDTCALGPGGLALDLVLRQPVACIPIGGEFALVDEDGVVLAGRWDSPPRLGRARLPVLGPLDDPLFARARDGDWLVEPEHTDALDVALSLSEHLGEERRAALGAIVIDARRARGASVSEPGVRLELEGERVALFGRPPAMGEPGELAPESKWRSLARALALFESDPLAGDWDLVDLRWDRPDVALRAPLVAAVEPRNAAATGRDAREEPDDSRPRVR